MTSLLRKLGRMLAEPYLATWAGFRDFGRMVRDDARRDWTR